MNPPGTGRNDAISYRQLLYACLQLGLALAGTAHIDGSAPDAHTNQQAQWPRRGERAAYRHKHACAHRPGDRDELHMVRQEAAAPVSLDDQGINLCHSPMYCCDGNGFLARAHLDFGRFDDRALFRIDVCEVPVHSDRNGLGKRREEDKSHTRASTSGL